MALKRNLRPTRQTIHTWRRSSESFKRRLSLKTRSGLSMRYSRRMRLGIGPLYRRKFRRKV